MQEQKIKAQELYDYFECPICYELLDGKQHFPRLLMCGHTFCQRCISLIIDRSQKFICSYCKTDLGQLRFGQTYKNFSILKLLELNQIQSKQQLSHTIIQDSFSKIVQQLDRTPKAIKKLIIKRTNDDEKNPFDFDLIRSNKNSMRFYKLLCLFQKLEQFQFWVKFSAHGFEQCLAQSLYEIQSLKKVKIVNQYDEYNRLRQIIPLTGRQNIQFKIEIKNWQNQ